MKYEKRLRSLSRRAGLCHEHLVPLVCHACTVRWVGSAAEWDELAGLLSRIDHIYRDIPSHGRCPQGHDLYCEPCWQRDAREALLAADEAPLSVEEMQRTTELLKLLQRQPA
jgi:hypothetical protein